MACSHNNYLKIVIAGKERLKLRNNMNIIAAQKMPVLPEILGTCGENLQSFHTGLLKVILLLLRSLLIYNA